MVFAFLRRIQNLKLDWPSLQVIATTSTVTTLLLLGCRYLGWLQQGELVTYDQLVRLRPSLPPDPRLLIVEITEDDIIRYQTPLSDGLVAKLLDKLQQQKPRVVGLDIFRDIPQGSGYSALVKQFQASNVIAITKIPSVDLPKGILPPPSVPPARVGFNDIVTDPDGVVRRALLFGGGPATNAFSFQVALYYLAPENKLPSYPSDDPDQIQWGQSLLTPLEKRSGGYQVNDDRGYQILLNYRNSKTVARQVTLDQVLKGKVDPSWIQDKIVLIGNTAASAKDFFFTPYSAVETINPRMFGVQVHGQIISQLLDAVTGDRPLFWFWPEWVECLWIALWASIGSSFALWLRHPLALGSGAIGSLGLLFGSSFMIVLHNGWVPVAVPALATLLAGGSTVTYRAQQSQRQQQMMMTLLGQNTSPEVATALWNSRESILKAGKLPGQKMVATMMFTDIKDFSTISEQMTPEALMVWLNEYLSVMVQEVQAHQGIINKFTGDGIMAVFGVPIARTAPEEIALDAQRAVACALAISDRLKLLNQAWQQQDLPSIQMRAGIFTGPIVAGSLGGKERMEYGVIGDSVNIASRLESCEKNRQGGLCRILIAYETKIHIENIFKVEPWGLLSLKGKQQMVDVYQVMGYLPEQSDPVQRQNQYHPQEHSERKSDKQDNPVHPKWGT